MELVVVMLIVSLVLAGIGDIYAQIMIRWGKQTVKSLATRKFTMLDIALTNEVREAMKMDIGSVGGNTIYTFTFPAINGDGTNTVSWSGGWLGYTQNRQVRYYLSDSTGNPGITGGTILWRATSSSVNGTFAPDVLWTKDSAGNPYYDNIEIFQIAPNPNSNSVRIRAKGIATEGTNVYGFEQSWGVMMRRVNISSFYVPLVPTATYLSSSSDPLATDAAPIDLQAYDIFPGDTITLEVVGDLQPGATSNDDFSATLGVFSTTSVLLSASTNPRVPGAIAPNYAGAISAYTTTHRNFGSNDLAQDFSINGNNASVMVPARVRYLFLSPKRNFFGDGTDPNTNYAVRIYKFQ